MHPQRPYWPHPARSRHALQRRRLSRQLLDLFVGEHAFEMGLRQYPQRTITGRRVVKTHAERDDSLERPGWRMRVEHTGLDRPWAPLGTMNAATQRQRRVLVPRDQPVAALPLVEESGPERHWC